MDNASQHVLRIQLVLRILLEIKIVYARNISSKPYVFPSALLNRPLKVMFVSAIRATFRLPQNVYLILQASIVVLPQPHLIFLERPVLVNVPPPLL